MATFALSEALLNSGTQETSNYNKEDLGKLGLTKDEIKEVAPTIGRSSVLGFFVGILPGAGATIASFLAYGFERNLASKEQKEEFGKGSLRGLAAPETANNAACSGSFVPLLTLGIPGSGTTAIMLGALISYGVQPGPRLFVDHPEVFWSVIISMYIGNIVLLFLNLPLIPYIARFLLIPKQFLLPFILFFSLIGVYLVSFNSMDIYIMVAVAVIALFLRLLEFPAAPMLLGFVLGKPLEVNLRRAYTIQDGSFSFLWQNSITLTIFAITMIVMLIPLWQEKKNRQTT